MPGVASVRGNDGWGWVAAELGRRVRFAFSSLPSLITSSEPIAMSKANDPVTAMELLNLHPCSLWRRVSLPLTGFLLEDAASQRAEEHDIAGQFSMLAQPLQACFQLLH